MKNFATADAPFASAVVGSPALFVSEVDESDGSIALYKPTVAVVNNLSLDHKSMEELRSLFAAFIAKAKTAVLNLDNAETAALAEGLPRNGSKGVAVRTYGIGVEAADLCATGVRPLPSGVAFKVVEKGGAKTETMRADVILQTPGRHNVSNALAALSVARALGVGLEQAAISLSGFKGIRRRMDVVGDAAGVTVIDDFAHNPDKLAASLATLREARGRVLAVFQPHGYGPLQLMGEEIAAALAEGLRPDDQLWVTEPVYYGGTVERAVSGADLAGKVAALGAQAHAAADRAAAGEAILALAKSGDRIVIMGARDDTLSDFARGLLTALAKR
jgi:UDP-N-acetylmuramate--alanine ligase